MKTKKPYSKPKLTIHGDVKEITFGFRTGNQDVPLGGGGGFLPS
ncbi:MAG TPA: lasso RiPP family leader peptide-containing protein [Allocoleopsis sp.]